MEYLPGTRGTASSRTCQPSTVSRRTTRSSAPTTLTVKGGQPPRQASGMSRRPAAMCAPSTRIGTLIGATVEPPLAQVSPPRDAAMPDRRYSSSKMCDSESNTAARRPSGPASGTANVPGPLKSARWPLESCSVTLAPGGSVILSPATTIPPIWTGTCSPRGGRLQA